MMNKRTVNQFNRIIRDLEDFATRLKDKFPDAIVCAFDGQITLLKAGTRQAQCDLCSINNCATKKDIDESTKIFKECLDKREPGKAFTVKSLLKEKWGKLSKEDQDSYPEKFENAINKGIIEGVVFSHKQGNHKFYKKAKL